METPALVASASLALVLFVCGVVLVLRSRAESRRALLAARAETVALRDRLDRLTEQLERQSSMMLRVEVPAHVVTDVGDPRPAANVSDRVVLSVTVGEPLVKLVAFVHGLHRALGAESRNKIGFEVRREVRRARKQRRREMKDAWRRIQADERSAQTHSHAAGAA